MATTFILEPEDYTNISFMVVRPDGPESRAVTGYSMWLETLELNEMQRIQYEYAQYQHREGGEVRDQRNPLVPIAFRCRVVGSGATEALKLADLNEKCNDLMLAICDSSGYLQYKPDGLAANIMSTYYRYIKSNPPEPTRAVWGKPAHADSNVEGYPTQTFRVTLMTQPIAVSNPASPVQVVNAVTLNNVGDGTQDYTTVTAATVKGSRPALTRVLAHLTTSGPTAGMGNLWIGKRPDPTNFAADYFTPTHQAPTGVWATQVDATRCNGQYYRCTPAANNTVYATRYTIANWDDHIGRANILAVVRNNGTSATDFDIYYRWAIGNYPLIGSDKNTVSIGSWQVVNLGTIDLPDTEMSGQEDLDLYIDVCIERTAGAGTFDLDCIKLIYEDETGMKLSMPAGYGADNTHSFFTESFEEEVAHTIVHATYKLAYILNAYGDFITLESDVDNRLDVIWDRFSPGSFSDSFTGYSDNWAKIASFEFSEDWNGGQQLSSYEYEGAYYLWVGSGNTTVELADQELDLSSFGSGDYICIDRLGASVTGLEIRLLTDAGNYYYHDFGARALADPTTGKDHLKVAKGSMSYTGSPNWADITELEIVVSGASGSVYLDNWRISAVDPNDSTTHNETGEVWDFPSGNWQTFELDDTAKSLGEITYKTSAEQVALIHTDYGEDVKFWAKVCARGNFNDKLGLVFRVEDGTDGSEDMYAFVIDMDNDEVELLSYVAGAAGNVVAPVAYTAPGLNEWRYMGVIVDGTSIKCYISSSLLTLWDAASEKFDTTDSDHTSGQCGVMVYGETAGRFTDVSVETSKELHVPADQLQLSVWALFRTIYPFHEAAT